MGCRLACKSSAGATTTRACCASRALSRNCARRSAPGRNNGRSCGEPGTEPFARFAEQQRHAEEEKRERSGPRTALPAARADEVNRERDEREEQHAGIHQLACPVGVLRLVDVIPPEKHDQRERHLGEAVAAEGVDAAGGPALNERRNERDDPEDDERERLGTP